MESQPPRLWRPGAKLSAHPGPQVQAGRPPPVLRAPPHSCLSLCPGGRQQRCLGAEALPGSSEAPSVPWGPLGCLHSHNLAAPGSLGPGASGTHSELSWAEGMGPIAREHSLATRGSQPARGRVSSVQASGDTRLTGPTGLLPALSVSRSHPGLARSSEQDTPVSQLRPGHLLQFVQ